MNSLSNDDCTPEEEATFIAMHSDIWKPVAHEDEVPCDRCPYTIQGCDMCLYIGNEKSKCMYDTLSVLSSMKSIIDRDRMRFLATDLERYT